MNYYQISKQLKVFTMICWSPTNCGKLQLPQTAQRDASYTKLRARTSHSSEQETGRNHESNTIPQQRTVTTAVDSNSTLRSAATDEKPKSFPRKSERNNDRLCFDPPRLKAMDENELLWIYSYIDRYRYYIYTAEYICSGKLAHHANWMSLIFLKQKHKTTGRFWRGYPTNSVEMFVTSGLKKASVNAYVNIVSCISTGNSYRADSLLKWTLKMEWKNNKSNIYQYT